MRVLIHFADREVMEAESDSLDQERRMFVARPTAGNNRLAWVSLSAVKYVVLPDAAVARTVGPPLEARGREKMVLRFTDGEVVRAFKDDGFSQEGHCFNVQLWDESVGRFQRAMVSVFNLKAIFFVEQWDSRSPEEKTGTTDIGRALPVR
jgi:hypothetical protein